MEDNVLYDKFDTNSDEEGDNMYDEMMKHEQIQQKFGEVMMINV